MRLFSFLVQLITFLCATLSLAVRNRKRKVWCSNPSRDIPKTQKQVVTAPFLNARNRWECHGSLKMTNLNRSPLPHHVRHAKEPSPPFTGNGDVSIWFKNSHLWRKNPKKQIKYISETVDKKYFLCYIDFELQIKFQRLTRIVKLLSWKQVNIKRTGEMVKDKSIMTEKNKFYQQKRL